MNIVHIGRNLEEGVFGYRKESPSQQTPPPPPPPPPPEYEKRLREQEEERMRRQFSEDIRRASIQPRQEQQYTKPTAPIPQGPPVMYNRADQPEIKGECRNDHLSSFEVELFLQAPVTVPGRALTRNIPNRTKHRCRQFIPLLRRCTKTTSPTKVEEKRSGRKWKLWSSKGFSATDQQAANRSK